MKGNKFYLAAVTRRWYGKMFQRKNRSEESHEKRRSHGQSGILQSHASWLDQDRQRGAFWSVSPSDERRHRRLGAGSLKKDFSLEDRRRRREVAGRFEEEKTRCR